MPLFDLHMHTKYSLDGEKTIIELMEEANELGIKHIAISDHNTTEAVGPALEISDNYKLNLIPAVELDCVYKGSVFHVLGYGIDPENPELKKNYADIVEQEIAAIPKRIELIREAGFPIDEEEALAQATRGIFVTGELVGEIVLSKENAKNNDLLKPYLPGGNRSDNPYVNFYWDWFSEGKPAYVHIEYISMAKAVEIINSAGGFPVLAHPGQNLKGRTDWIDDIVKQGIEGIECYCSYHDAKQANFYEQEAERLNLLVTCGSDYHGKTKPSVKMGGYGLDDPKKLEIILDNFYKRLNSGSK